MTGLALITNLIDLSRLTQTCTRAIKWLIMRLNSHDYLPSCVGWWETILELLIWLGRISHNAYHLYSYPSLIFPRKQIMQSLMYVRWVRGMTGREVKHEALPLSRHHLAPTCMKGKELVSLSCYTCPAKSSSVSQMFLLQCHVSNLDHATNHDTVPLLTVRWSLAPHHAFNCTQKQ